MTPSLHTPDLDDILEDFAAQPRHDRATLEAYLARYPEHAGALLDLSHELRLQSRPEACPIPEADEAWLEESWRRFSASAFPAEAAQAAPDPFARLTAGQLADVRRDLDVPTAVVTAFRDRCVEASTVPLAFLRRFAKQLNASLDEFLAHLDGPPRLAAATSHKSGAAPQAPREKMTFEAVLVDALVPAERRKALLTEGD